MAMDEVLLRAAGQPLLRVYGWSAPAVSFGYFGRFAEVRRLWPARELVRRWTGGGIVPHGEDFTYTLVVPRGEPFAGRPAGETYRLIHEAVAAAMGDADGALTFADGRAESVGRVFCEPGGARHPRGRDQDRRRGAAADAPGTAPPGEHPAERARERVCGAPRRGARGAGETESALGSGDGRGGTGSPRRSTERRSGSSASDVPAAKENRAKARPLHGFRKRTGRNYSGFFSVGAARAPGWCLQAPESWRWGPGAASSGPEPEWWSRAWRSASSEPARESSYPGRPASSERRWCRPRAAWWW